MSKAMKNKEGIAAVNDRTKLIKCRVIRRGPIICLPNGTTKQCRLMVQDQHAKIEITMTGPIVDLFADDLEVNKAYEISNFGTMYAHPQYCLSGHRFELKLLRTSIIVPLYEAECIPLLDLEFTPISNISDLSSKSIIDVLGVCVGVGALQPAHGTIIRRMVILADESHAQIELSLTGAVAEEFSVVEGQTISAKGVHVTGLVQKSLSTSQFSEIDVI